jgi:copper chaperone CopZ
LIIVQFKALTSEAARKMDYMSMHDWFYGPPEPTWILPATSYYDPPAPPAFLHAGTTSLYEPAAQNYTRSSMQYVKKLQEAAAAPDQPAARPLRSTAAATAYEQPDQQQLRRRMYNHVKELGEEESDELKKNLMSGGSSTSNNYYHVYPKVQTAADGPVRTHQESRARMVDSQGSEVSHEKLVSKEIKKKESSPAAFPFKNLPIELKVPMCCEKCAKKVYDRILDLPGVEDVTTDQYNQKVIVTGNVDPSRVLSRVKQVKKHSVFWDQNVEYSQVYLKKQKDREMAMIQAGKKQQQQASESSSSSSSSAAKGSSSSLQKLALDGKGGSPNTTSSSMIHQQLPEHETSHQTKKQLYQSSHDEADGKLMQGPNVKGIMNNILGPRAESNPQRSSRMQYREAPAREEQDMNHTLPGPNVQVNILPQSGAIQRMMPGFESESRLHTHQQQYPSPDHLKGYRQELYNAQAAGLQWPDDDEEHHHYHQHQHHNRQPEELLYAHYNPYVRN